MNDVKSILQWPAIALIIVGALNLLSGSVLILGRVVSIVKGREPVITDEDRRLGYMFAIIFFPLVSLISIAASPKLFLVEFRCSERADTLSRCWQPYLP